ncbi:zf-CCHC domain-containing protein [Tanacetum coccineum]
MTRNSTNELFTPYKEPGREFRSSRRHFKTLSLDELRSPDFNLLSDQEYSEEEEAKTMAETMEHYMSKTRTDYGSRGSTICSEYSRYLNWAASRCAKPKNQLVQSNLGKNLKTKFEQFATWSTAKKIEEINNFQQEPDETLYQAWERFKELLITCPQHYLTEMQEVILFYNGLDVPTRLILDSRGVVPTTTAEDAKKAIQKMVDYSQKWHNGTSRGRSTKTSDELAAIQAQLNNLGREINKVNEKVYAAQVGWGYRATAPGYYQRNNANPSYQERRQSMEDNLSKFMSESAKRHKENSNLIKEIRATTNAAIRNQGASMKTLEIQIGQMSKKKRGTMDQNLRKLMELHITITPYLKRRKTQEVSLYLALLINFGIKRLLDDLRVTVAKLMLLVYKLLLSVFRVTTAERLQLLKDKDCLKIKITYEMRILRLQGSSSSGEDQYKWHQSLFAWRTFLRRHGLRSAMVNAPPITKVVEGVETTIAPTTAEEKA